MLTPMSTGMIIQGRQLFADDIELIRHLMAEHPDWHRCASMQCSH